MNRLSREKQIEVLNALVEGNSIRATVRMTGVAKNTISKLLLEIGEVCQNYHDEHVQNLNSKRIQCDEIWNFVYAKEKNLPADLQGHESYGSIWTWTAIDADSKLMVSYLVGKRDGYWAYTFMKDVASRVSNRIQLTTDAHSAYFTAVRESFGENVDYAMLIKKYGKAPEDRQAEVRYSPAVCTGIEKKPKIGNPDPDEISTSYVERQNLTMRMSMRRFTRLTNGFSKKIENLEAAVALHFMHYNFVRIHQTIRCTPAMEAGITNRLWTMRDIVDLLP